MFEHYDIDDELKWQIKNLSINIKWYMPEVQQNELRKILAEREVEIDTKLQKARACYGECKDKVLTREVNPISSALIANVSYLMSLVPAKTIGEMVAIYGNGDLLSIFTSAGGTLVACGTALYLLNKYCYANKPLTNKVNQVRQNFATKQLLKIERKKKVEDYFKSCLYGDRKEDIDAYEM